MHSQNIKIKKALLSCSDKAGLVELAEALIDQGVELISTGGTKDVLIKAGLKVTPIEKVTGNPEAFGGRMKTISFQVESALLWRRFHPQDQEDAKKLKVDAIDLVVCNLYPFAKTVEKGGSEDELIENIDIGGPTMVRAAAKNYEAVAVLTDPHQYESFLKEFVRTKGELSFELRRRLATQAFVHTAQYEGMIASELSKRFLAEENLFLGLTQAKKLRYGENPHQSAVYFSKNTSGKITERGVGEVTPLQGKEISYNNLLDADAAWKCASDLHAVNLTHQLQLHTVVIIKHLNPCGVALAHDTLSALTKAWAADPTSAFGGILCFSHPIDEDVAKFLASRFVEVIIAPKFTDQAKQIFNVKKNVRLLELPLKDLAEGQKKESIVRSLSGGILVQDEDQGLDVEFKTVSKRPWPKDLAPLAQWGSMVAKHLKSNAIALVAVDSDGDFILAGAGMGQPNRIESLHLLAKVRAQDRKLAPLEKCVLISDAFFPFADSIEACQEVGIKYIVQPGGSIRDQEVIDRCNDFEMSMVFTSRRHFRH